MAADAVALLNRLGVDRADVLGYSMGGWVGLSLLADHADRVRSLVAAGVGERLLTDVVDRERIAAALEAPDAADVTDERAREFQQFAEARDNDLAALAAVQRAREPAVDPDRLSADPPPTLVVAGAADDLVGDPGTLAAAIPGAEAVTVPNGDHLSTTGATRFTDATLEFLGQVDGTGGSRGRGTGSGAVD